MTSITSTTGTISSAGIGSGLDVNSIISSLMAVESLPLNALQAKATTLQTDLSAFGQVQSLVSALQDAAKPLFDPNQFKLTNTSSSDSSSVSATTTTGAVWRRLRRSRCRRCQPGSRWSARPASTVTAPALSALAA